MYIYTQTKCFEYFPSDNFWNLVLNLKFSFKFKILTVQENAGYSTSSMKRKYTENNFKKIKSGNFLRRESYKKKKNFNEFIPNKLTLKS